MCVHTSRLKEKGRLVSPQTLRKKGISLPAEGNLETRQPGQQSPWHPLVLTAKADSHEVCCRRQAERCGKVRQGDLLNYLHSSKRNTPTPQK